MHFHRQQCEPLQARRQVHPKMLPAFIHLKRMKPWPGRVASRWPISWPQSCSSSPPAQVIAVSHAHAGHRCLYSRSEGGREGGVYFLSLNQALLPPLLLVLLLLPGRTAILCCRLLSSFTPPDSYLKPDGSRSSHNDTRSFKKAKTVEADGEGWRGKHSR